MAHLSTATNKSLLKRVLFVEIELWRAQAKSLNKFLTDICEQMGKDEKLCP